MSYLSDWKEWEENARLAREAPLCDESDTCPAPDDGHLIGCRRNRQRIRESFARNLSDSPAEEWAKATQH